MGEHDIFFKKTFSIKEHAVDYLKNVLPLEVVSDLDFTSLELENSSYVDDELSEHFSDIVYSCFFNNNQVKIAFLFEHKSYPYKNLPFQLNKYMVKIWDENIKQKTSLVPILPVVLYHGKQKWSPGRLKTVFNDLAPAISEFIPDFNYVFVNLGDYEDSDLMGTSFSQDSLKMSLLILKNIFYAEKLEKELRHFFEIGKSFLQDENGLQFLESILKYIYRVTELETLKVVDAIKPVTEKGGEIAMTTAEKLRQEGRQEASYDVLASVARNMKRSGESDKKIARLMGLDESFVKKLLRKEKVEIPSDFFSSDK